MSEEHEPFDVADEEAKRLEEEKRKERLHLEYLEGVRYMLADRRGRRFMRVLLGRAEVLRSSYIPDPGEMN